MEQAFFESQPLRLRFSLIRLLPIARNRTKAFRLTSLRSANSSQGRGYESGLGVFRLNLHLLAKCGKRKIGCPKS
ncbi:MAG: hypothetical protein IJR49_02930 [Treponema sp.]|nr:hypothetical protein [Treponema sp.]